MFLLKKFKKIALSSNDDKIMQSFDSIETYWLQIPGHPYRILIIGRSESRKTNSLFHLINEEPGIDKIYLYAKDTYEEKCQFLN